MLRRSETDIGDELGTERVLSSWAGWRVILEQRRWSTILYCGACFLHHGNSVSRWQAMGEVLRTYGSGRGLATGTTSGYSVVSGRGTSPGGRGKTERSWIQSCFNHGSIDASGLGGEAGRQ